LVDEERRRQRMSDEAIIEAAERALRDSLGPAPLLIILAAVTPLIEAAALERAAKEAEDCVTGEDAAYNIRALKEQP
jgi:hypothetical protein